MPYKKDFYPKDIQDRAGLDPQKAPHKKLKAARNRDTGVVKASGQDEVHLFAAAAGFEQVFAVDPSGLLQGLLAQASHLLAAQHTWVMMYFGGRSKLTASSGKLLACAQHSSLIQSVEESSQMFFIISSCQVTQMFQHRMSVQDRKAHFVLQVRQQLSWQAVQGLALRMGRWDESLVLVGVPDQATIPKSVPLVGHLAICAKVWSICGR